MANVEKEVIGYHGTDFAVKDKIISDGYKFSDKNKWFGAGIYFFEDFLSLKGETEAYNWAKNVKKIKNVAVFKAKIASKTYFDFIENDEHRKIFKEIRDELLAQHVASAYYRKKFDEFRVFSVLSKYDEIEYIRMMVDASKYKGYWSPYIKHPQIQICVKKHNAIKENNII